jgi:hypothetical protein
MVSAGFAPGDRYWYQCYDCWGYPELNKVDDFEQTGTNVLVATVNYNSNGNRTLLDSGFLSEYVDNSYLTAQQVAAEIFDRYCVVGVFVINKHIGEYSLSIDY